MIRPSLVILLLVFYFSIVLYRTELPHAFGDKVELAFGGLDVNARAGGEVFAVAGSVDVTVAFGQVIQIDFGIDVLD